MGTETDSLLPDPPEDHADAPWIIEVKPAGDGPPMAVRMRRALKRLLRDYGVRCIRVRDPRPGEIGATDDSRETDR